MTETRQDKLEAQRVRRRWLTLGELLAIAAVLISALTLWNSYSERTSSQAEHRADAARSARSSVMLLLKGTPDAEGNVLTLAPRSDAQSIQGQTVAFPTALGLAPVETSSDARIERRWLEAALVRARKDAGAPGRTMGDARLPLLITTQYLVDGEAHTDRAIYEVGYVTSGSFLGGTSVHLRGLSRQGAVASDTAGQKKLDALAKVAIR